MRIVGVAAENAGAHGRAAAGDAAAVAITRCMAWDMEDVFRLTVWLDGAGAL